MAAKKGNFKWHKRITALIVAQIEFLVISAMFSELLQVLHLTPKTWKSLGLNADFDMLLDGELSKFLHELGYKDAIIERERATRAVTEWGDADTLSESHRVNTIVTKFLKLKEFCPSLLWLAIITRFPSQYLYEGRYHSESSRYPKPSIDMSDIYATEILKKTMKEGFQACLDNLANREGIKKLVDLNRATARLTKNLDRIPTYISTYGGSSQDLIEQQARGQVLDFIIGLSNHFFGVYLARVRGQSLSPAEVERTPVDLSFLPDLRVYGCEEYGNVIVGEVKLPSIDPIVDSLGTENTVNSISALKTLLTFMLTNECLYGVLTDSFTYLFIELVSVKRTGKEVAVEIRYYSTKASRAYVSKPTNLSPRAALLTFLGLAIIPGPQKYKQRVEETFSDTREWTRKEYVDSLVSVSTERNNELFHSMVLTEGLASLPINTEHQQITYNILKKKKNRFKADSDSQVFSIPSRKFRDCNGNRKVVAKVFDPRFLLNCGEADEWLHYESSVMIGLTRNLRRYNRIYEYNSLVGSESDMAINVVRIHQVAFCSFWSDEGRSAKSHILAGPTIVMERLKRKPQSVEDFRKGFDQLIRCAAAGLLFGYIDMKIMFMRKGLNQEDEFVFTKGWSEFLSSTSKHWMQIDSRHYDELNYFLHVMEDTIPGQFSRYRIRYFFKKSVKNLRKRIRASKIPAWDEESARVFVVRELY